jgi:hypothetical protein
MAADQLGTTIDPPPAAQQAKPIHYSNSRTSDAVSNKRLRLERLRKKCLKLNQADRHESSWSSRLQTLLPEILLGTGHVLKR